MIRMSRRDMAKALGGLGVAAFGLGSIGGRAQYDDFLVDGYGPLRPDPARLLDLPDGFSYRVISRLGNIMDDGLPVPDKADGMGAFDLGGGKVALVRNHELKARDGTPSDHLRGRDAPFGTFDRTDAGLILPGGTSTLVYDMSEGRVTAEWMSLAGTIRNCAGGVTPWGSWLTCEEDVTKAGEGVGRDHGWVFEVPAKPGVAAAEPLTAMGRFNHEAAAVDPVTGIVYLTEDREDSLFYRFVPNAKGELAKGGRLQALSLPVADTRNWTGADMPVRQSLPSRWIDLDNPESPDDDLRARGAAKGASLFARGEGIVMGMGADGPEFFFTATSGGAAKNGQIFRHSPHRLDPTAKPARDFQLFFESPGQSVFHFGDNLNVMPNGDLIVCEDGYEVITDNHLRGVTPEGGVYGFARLRIQTEPAGVCFSPDGSTMFVNLYSPATTLAITGPWNRRKA